MTLSFSDRAILERRVRGLVTPALVAEHREHPFGPHSPELVEVVDFLRRNPDPDLPRYLVLRTGERFCIAARAALPGAPAQRAEEADHPSRAEAEHAVFLRRLADYGMRV
jgi:hypothetical protein